MRLHTNRRLGADPSRFSPYLSALANGKRMEVGLAPLNSFPQVPTRKETSAEGEARLSAGNVP